MKTKVSIKRFSHLFDAIYAIVCKCLNHVSSANFPSSEMSESSMKSNIATASQDSFLNAIRFLITLKNNDAVLR